MNISLSDVVKLPISFDLPIQTHTLVPDDLRKHRFINDEHCSIVVKLTKFFKTYFYTGSTWPTDPDLSKKLMKKNCVRFPICAHEELTSCFLSHTTLTLTILIPLRSNKEGSYTFSL